MPLKKFNDEVYYSDDEIIKLSQKDIADFKTKAVANERERARLCSHRDVDDTLHEMVIIHTKGTYVRPHKHVHKSESFHVIEGRVDVIIYDESGNIANVIEMGNYASGLYFYYRLNDPLYHTLLIHSDFLVFHETTNGPFIRENTIFAPWAPEEKNTAAVKKFMDELVQAVSAKAGEAR